MEAYSIGRWPVEVVPNAVIGTMLEIAVGSRAPEDRRPRPGLRWVHAMRFSRTFLALALLAGCQTAPSVPPVASDETMTFRILHSSAYGVAANADAGTARDARVAIASTEEEYEALWSAHIGEEPRPPVDFARESAVFLLLGQRSTGGWSVAPESVTIRGNAVDVIATIGRPAPGGVTTMAFSAPYAVIAVPQPGLQSATWKEPGGNVVVSAAEPPR